MVTWQRPTLYQPSPPREPERHGFPEPPKVQVTGRWTPPPAPALGIGHARITPPLLPLRLPWTG
jgi:hypothetical protein